MAKAITCARPAEELVQISHWSEYHRRWSQLEPPLRPNRDVVAAFDDAIRGHESRVLVLGVTPELADLGRETIAVDRNAEMIAHVWPGDTGSRQALGGDWRALDLPERSFTAAVGDGSLNNLLYPQAQVALYAQLLRLLRPGGVFACRLFATPEEPETMAAIAAKTWSRQIASFHAFKWHLAMAIAATTGDPNVPVVSIRDALIRHFPDRTELASVTGWSRDDIDTIEVYKNSPEIYSFPTLTQFRAVIPPGFEEARVVQAGVYPLAERCPLLVMARAS